MRERSNVFETETEAIHERYEESVAENITKKKVAPKTALTKY